MPNTSTYEVDPPFKSQVIDLLFSYFIWFYTIYIYLRFSGPFQANVSVAPEKSILYSVDC